jgi:hypothetical protein
VVITVSERKTQTREHESAPRQTHRTLPEQTEDRLKEDDAVLLLCPSFAEEESEACIDLLTLEDPDRTNVLSVAFTESPHDRFEAWSRHADGQPPRMSIVSLEADTRSVGSVNPIDGRDAANAPDQVTIETVSSPENLTELGFRIVERLEAWNRESPDRRTVVCFHSLTTLLQYVSVDEAFEFLFTLMQHTTMDDATAHCHLDPAAHDEETVDTLGELFDVACEFDGEWTVRESRTDLHTDDRHT